jgi:hypothetical protein
MIDVLNRHCRPDSVTDAFATLMSLFNDVQGDSESIVEFWSHFDGMIMDMSRCKVVIPPLLLVMIFIHALHLHCSDILNQFRSRYKGLESATVDSVVADIKYHDSFQLVDHNKKAPKKGGPVASAVAVDRSGKEWSTPFKSKLLRLGGTGLLQVQASAPICHRAKKPWHVPTNCPLLKDLNLKLVAGPPPHPARAPANSPTPAPAPASTSPGGHIASTDVSASGSAPSGLMASVADEEYNSDPEFRWTGDEDGVLYSGDSGSCKSNHRVAPYPSCSHAAVVSPSPPSFPTMGSSSPAASSSCRDSSVDHSNSPPPMSLALHSLLARLSQCPIAPGSGGRFAIADSGATDHMFPDKSAFISYKTTSNLKVRMGNNTYLPVLAWGSAIISLNGQRVLVRHALHVPGLAVPLYSFRANFKQRGCRERQNERQWRSKRRRQWPQMIHHPGPALQTMEPEDGTPRREENRCNNQPDKRHKSGGTRGIGATRGAGGT